MSDIKLIDSHCHPHFDRYDSDREAVIERALEAGVGMIGVGVDLATSKREIEIASTHQFMWAAVGLHPNDNEQELKSADKELKEYEELLEHPKVVAIGEVGLDYYRTPEPEKQDRQREFFKNFIGLALRHNKPLIVHCRNAHYEMPAIIKSCLPNSGAALNGVIHSFTGTWRDAQEYISLGFYIGLNGIVTFAQQYNETVVKAPLEKILLETDAPFLTPVPFRGQRNEPVYVIQVAKKVAELKGLSVEHVMRVTTENAKHLFGIAL